MLNLRIDRLFHVRDDPSTGSGLKALVEPCKIPFDRLRANGNQTNLTLSSYLNFHNMSKVRTAARALIIKDRKLLLIKNKDHDGDWYMLPGGGQIKNHTLEETLHRECLEETGYEVSMGPLVLVREYISNNHEFKNTQPDVHQIDLIFQCTLTEKEATIPTEMDIRQTGTAWVNLNKIKELRLYPAVLKECFDENGFLPRENIFLGDVN